MKILYIIFGRTLLFLIIIPSVSSFTQWSPKTHTSAVSELHLFGGGGGSTKIPSSSNERDSIAITAIKAAISKPKTPNYGLIECEFPPLTALNKLGDGSLRSAKEVDNANLKFVSTLVSSISPFGLGPKVWILISRSASSGLERSAKKSKIGTPYSLRDGEPSVAAKDICVFVSPSARTDYTLAQELAEQCKAVVLVNSFAKDPKSVPARATMAYYLKPLTYNSQVVGHLTRIYPGSWKTIDFVSKKVLLSKDDSQILVKGTNTPDLRESGRLVQKSVDERAIKERQQRR